LPMMTGRNGLVRVLPQSVSRLRRCEDISSVAVAHEAVGTAAIAAAAITLQPAGPPPLVVELIDDPATLESLRPAWGALHEAAGTSRGAGFNPFMDWLWTSTWWQSHDRGSPLRQPRYRLHVLVFRDRKATVRAIVPFVGARWGIGPLSFRALRMFGFGPCTVDVRSPLVWPGWETVAADALARELLSPDRRPHDLAILDGLSVESLFTKRLDDWARVEGWSWGPSIPSHLLALPTSWEALLKGLRRDGFRKTLRQRYNRLTR
jgi:hypothetical protein